MNKLTQILLSMVLCLPLVSGSQSKAASNAPYPASKIITKLTWSPDIVKAESCISGDNWPIAWISDSLQITAFCDGRGFSKQAPDLSLGFAKVVGDPPGFGAENFESDADTPMGGGSSGIKASDMIAVDGIRVAKEGVDGYWLELYVDKSDDAVIDLAKQYAALDHEAKGAWRGGRLPFENHRPGKTEPPFKA